MILDFEMVEKFYRQLPEKLNKVRAVLNKKLTLTEKILYSHTDVDQLKTAYERGKSYVNFFPDRVALQDATAQMVILQFMQAGKNKVSVPTTVHADHLIQADIGAKDDLNKAVNTNAEVYNFLASSSKKFGIGFWKPGAGIIHQVVLENYAFPGGLMIGADSHTVNAGGLGMVAVGVGGADAVDVMVGMPWELLFPKITGIKLTGKLNPWVSAKDIILKVAGIMTVKGGTGKIVEYFGEGANSLSCTGKGTISNMGAEIGATTSTFGYDEHMEAYLRATGRAEVADLANGVANCLKGDEEVYQNPEEYFDEIIEIDLNTLEPHINGPFTPDRAIPISKFKEEVIKNEWPKELEVGLIGSCTNSSYEDISRAASLARQAVSKNLKVKSDFTITPGSEQVRYTIERDGFINDFEQIGGVVMANACGPCIGQWKRHTDDPTRKNSIITSFNRNFAKRNDGNPNTHSFVASPEMVTALTIAGDMTFNPLTDTLLNESGESVKLDEPRGDQLPIKGFAVEDPGYEAPAEDGSDIRIDVAADSDRIQLISPFAPFDASKYDKMRLLIKVKGKCTTDHISMAGPWLKYRGHLDNISNNLLIGATNNFNDQVNSVKNHSVKNHLGDSYGEVPKVQREYKAAGIASIVVGDENYGEGSSREHAAMEPRHLGIYVVLVKSFARIHETNLKKQGMLGLTFANPADYDKIQEDDQITVEGISDIQPGTPLTLTLHHGDGSSETIQANHTYNENQIAWLKAGSALNLIKANQG